MSGVTHTWDGDGAFRALTDEAWERIQRCTLFFWDELQTVLNQRINPPPYLNSAPKGEPPAKRTGFGAANTKYELDRAAFEGRVGVTDNAIYMLFQEVSPKLNHPWFKVTLDRVMPQLRNIVAGGKP